MTSLLLAAVVLFATPGCAAPDPAHATFARVLAAHVRDGAVDYSGLRRQRAPLDAYLAAVENTCAEPYRALPPPQRLAFLINAYNAAVLRLMLEHPDAGSVREALSGEAFKRPLVGVGALLAAPGRRVSLDALETAIRRFGDARIHFALVCGARSCPPLRFEPYQGDRLDAQLEAQTRAFLASAEGVRVEPGGLVRVSQLFEWYASDFGGVRKFLSRYRPELASDAGGYDLAFLPYDWSPNGR